MKASNDYNNLVKIKNNRVAEIELEIDSLDAYDYENSTNTKYFSSDMKRILTNIIDEVNN